jgi:hypothetical protein
MARSYILVPKAALWLPRTLSTFGQMIFIIKGTWYLQQTGHGKIHSIRLQLCGEAKRTCVRSMLLGASKPHSCS